jgi:uncharacterized membrane protein HdeD (DUF308 family)
MEAFKLHEKPMLYRAGPMNIYVRIRTRFGTRVAEWMLAAVTALWGTVLLLPTDTYTTSPVFNFISHVISEPVLGAAMLFFGLLRIVGLFVNGARQDVTPWIRVVSASFGFLVWSLICFSFALSGVISTWAATYTVFAVTEVFNVYRAAHDAGAYARHVA